MKTPRLLIALTLVNAVLVLAALLLTVGPRPAWTAPSPDQMLRGRGLEIVDERGRVRASIAVLPASTSADGERTAETVLLRLITERGRPSVKIGASEKTAGASFAGPTGTNDTYIIVQAGATASSLKLRNENGREQIVTP